MWIKLVYAKWQIVEIVWKLWIKYILLNLLSTKPIQITNSETVWDFNLDRGLRESAKETLSVNSNNVGNVNKANCEFTVANNRTVFLLENLERIM